MNIQTPTGYIKTVSEVIQSADVWCYDKLHSTFTCMEALANGTSNCLAYTDPDTMAHVALRFAILTHMTHKFRNVK